LEIAEEEFDQRVNELQMDVSKLRNTLSENSNAQRQAEKEKSMLIQTLTEQNQRLTQQLKEVSQIFTFFKFIKLEIIQPKKLINVVISFWHMQDLKRQIFIQHQMVFLKG
jgi:hypothetical protein